MAEFVGDSIVLEKQDLIGVPVNFQLVGDVVDDEHSEADVNRLCQSERWASVFVHSNIAVCRGCEDKILPFRQLDSHEVEAGLQYLLLKSIGRPSFVVNSKVAILFCSHECLLVLRNARTGYKGLGRDHIFKGLLVVMAGCFLEDQQLIIACNVDLFRPLRHLEVVGIQAQVDGLIDLEGCACVVIDF